MSAVPADNAELQDIDPEILEIFIEESSEIDALISTNLKAWQIQPDNLALVAELGRSFHTLKGSGRLVGAEQVAEFAAAMEHLCEQAARGKLQPGPAFFNAFNDVVNQGSLVVEAFRTRRQAFELGVDLPSLMEHVAGLTRGETPSITSEAVQAESAEEYADYTDSDELLEEIDALLEGSTTVGFESEDSVEDEAQQASSPDIALPYEQQPELDSLLGELNESLDVIGDEVQRLQGQLASSVDRSEFSALLERVAAAEERQKQPLQGSGTEQLVEQSRNLQTRCDQIGLQLGSLDARLHALQSTFQDSIEAIQADFQQQAALQSSQLQALESRLHKLESIPVLEPLSAEERQGVNLPEQQDSPSLAADSSAMAHETDAEASLATAEPEQLADDLVLLEPGRGKGFAKVLSITTVLAALLAAAWFLL